MPTIGAPGSGDKTLDPGSLLWDLRCFVRSPFDRCYASLLDAGKRKVTGEVTPQYLTVEDSDVAHIQRLLSNAGPFPSCLFP